MIAVRSSESRSTRLTFPTARRRLAGDHEAREPTSQHRFRTHRLVELEGLHDPVPGVGVDHEALLVARDHLLGGGIEVEQAPVEAQNVLHEGDLQVEPRLLDHALRVAELEHDDLLDLMYGEQRGPDENRQQHADSDDEAGHLPLSFAGSLARRRSTSGKGR
jgi:hypothetical protein